jgi:branched-chain amino acid transport system permease protein
MNTLRFPAVAGLTLVLAAALAILLPQWIGFYYLQVVNLTLVSALLALGLNFILGYAGQMSLAQAAFFGIGAYGFAILQALAVPAPLAALGAVGITSAVGLLLGAPTLRLRGHYLALATLAFAVIVEKLLVNLDVLTGGANGLSDVPGIGLAGDNVAMLRVLLAVVAVAFLASVAFATSPLGLRTRAFRDDPVAAQAIGVNVSRLKVMLFVISAAYAGLAGVAYVCLRGYISPDVFAWQTTFAYLAMVVVGGLGSSVGALLGAVLYTLVPEWLRFLQEAYFVIFGLVVVLVITFFPAGLAGLLSRLVTRPQRKPGPVVLGAKLQGRAP